MAQILTRTEAITLVSNALDEAYETAGAASKPTYPKVVKVETMDRGQEINYRIAGFGQHVERGSLEDITYDQYEFGELQTVVPLEYGLGFRVADSIIDDLAANPYGDFSQLNIATYGDVTKRFRRSATRTIENKCAALFLNSTSTAAPYVGRDGLALFSASHVTLKNPPITYSNLQTQASLSAILLQGMIIALMTQPDDTGDFMDTGDSYRVIVSPYNLMRLTDILKTKGQVDTNNNNTNPLSAFNIDPVMWKYLGTSHKGFYMQDIASHSMRYLERQKPTFMKEGDFEAVAQKYRSTYRGVATTKDPHGVVGNLGL